MPHFTSRHGLFASLLVTTVAVPCSVALQAARPDPKAFDTAVKPALAAHCTGCHSAERQVGGVDLSGLADGASAARQRRLWRRISAQVEAGSMPPKGSKPLSPAARAALLQWAHAAAEYLDPQDPARRDPGPSVLRRLTLTEYNRTIRDLFGIDFDAEAEVGLPGSENTTGFDNLAATLTLSPALLDKYLAAAEKVGERVFADGKARQALLAPAAGKEGREAAGAVTQRLLRGAYRRPPRPEEIERLLKLYDRARAEGAEHEAAVRALLKPVLASPHFLFRVEADPPGAAARVNAHELAVRLSYFLWSTAPDAELSQLADAGRLSEPAVLEAQVRRMLADPRAWALTDGFGEQWLQLRKLAQARPSTEFFPAFNARLREAMRQETTLFFDGLRTEDRSVLELLDADYTYLNEELARHYGVEGVSGKELRRVALRPEHRRGGLLGMGSVLALTSHTFRTSPTLRGKYVLEVILGTPPPPPPPNAAGMLQEKQESEAASFRQQLARHASDPSCAGCHRKLDPLGFALDNYDAVGAWRESTPERKLDTTGELPTGEKLTGAADLKRVLLARKREFARNLAAQMLSYALGRELEESDEWTLRETVDGLEKNGYRFSSLVLGITRSVPFQYRRGRG
ncbi:MAG: DUF1592 domain-containing protein [Armatimonadota bacterium]